MPFIEKMSAVRQRGAAADAMIEEALLAALPPQDIAAVNAQIQAEAPAVANLFTQAYGLTPPAVAPARAQSTSPMPSKLINALLRLRMHMPFQCRLPILPMEAVVAVAAMVAEAAFF